MSEIENILSRIKSHKSVEGYMVSNLKGDIIKTTYIGEKKQDGDRIISYLPELVHKTQITVKNLDTDDELQFLRIKTKKNEVLIAPDKEFVLIVVQTPFVKNEKDQDSG